MTDSAEQRVYAFASFKLDTNALELKKANVRVRLSGKPMEALVLLVEEAGRIVKREELQQRLWGSETFVDFEDSLNHAIGRLREALGDDPKSPRFVETVPGVGYRFVARLDAAPDQESPPKPVSATSGRPKWAWVAGAALLVVAAWAVLNVVPDAEPEVESPPAGAQTPSIAVLPFDNISALPEHRVFADSIADSLTNELAKIGSLRVISRTSTLRYRQPVISLPEIAKELGATHVIEGSALLAGGRVRIIAQLIEAASDEHLWAGSYEEPPDGLIGLQGRVAAEIARAIQIELTPEEEARLAAARPVDLETYTTYSQARDASANGRVAESIRLLERTIELDPDYAPAYSWLADAYIRGGWWNQKPDDVLYRAKEVALKALRLDETLADPHLILGQVRSNFEWEWEDAERHYLRALELNPSYAQAYLAYGNYLVIVNRSDEAIRMAEEALKIDPLSVQTIGGAGQIHHAARSFDRAIDLLKTARGMTGDGPFWRVELACVYTMSGKFDEAVQELAPLADVAGPDPRPRSVLAWSYAVAGDREKAFAIRDDLEAEFGSDDTRSYWIAYVHAALGDLDKAFAMLDRAAEDRWPYVGSVTVLPPYDSLRSDLRHEIFLERIGLKGIGGGDAAVR